MFGVADPDLVAAVQTYVKLMRAHRSVVEQVERRLAGEGLTVNQLGVLEALLHKGSLTHRELREKILTSAGNLTDVVDKLSARGLVRRIKRCEDRRQVAVELTPVGRTMIEELFPRHAADIGRAMSGLGRADQAALAPLLRQLGRAAAALDATAGPDHLGRDRSISNDVLQEVP